MNSRPCGVCSILNQPCNAGCFWAQSIKVEEDEKEDGKFRLLLRGDLDTLKVEGLRNLIVNTKIVARQHYVDDLHKQILFESALAIAGLNRVNRDFVALFSQAEIKTVLDLTKQHGKEWVERELSDVANGLVQSAKEDDKTKAAVLLISELFSEEDRIAILDLTKQHGKEWVERKLLDGLVQIAKEDEKAEAEVLLIGELFSEEGITAILDIVKQLGKEWVVSKLAYVVTDLVQKANSSACAVAVGDSAAYHRTLVFGDDVVIVANRAYRAPICEANCGSFKDTYAKDLLALVLKAVIEKTNVNPSEVGDIVVGTVLTPGSQRATECRMAAFYAGFPETVPIRIVDRQCSSGLQAIADVAAAIRDGFYDIGIGASLESMTSSPLAGEGLVNPKVKIFEQAQNCLLPMGITSENVAHHFGVTRQEQDQAAVESRQQAAAATAFDKLKDEIILVPTKIVDPKTGDEKPITISIDDGIRPNARFSDLAKLQPVSMNDGSTTAGNSSQVSDGAGAVLLMKRSIAVQKGLPILGVFRTFAVVSAIMGVGPATAIPAAVKASGLELDDIDLFVINEAFASQFVACPNELELDPEKVNVNGGATGACVATLLHEMKHRGKDCRYGVISMCMGSGMGAAAVFEKGDAVDDLCNAQMAQESQNADDKMWTPHIEKIFIDIMVDEQQKGNMEHGIFKAPTWLSITNALNEQTERSFHLEQVIQKHNSLRQKQRKWSQLLGHTGLGWDETTQTVTPPEEADPKANALRKSGCPSYDKLWQLFAPNVATGAFQISSNALAPDSDEERAPEEKIANVAHRTQLGTDDCYNPDMEGITQDDPLATEQTQRADKRPIEEPTSKGKKVAKKADRASDMTIALQEYIALTSERFNKKKGKSLGSSDHIAQFASGGNPCSLGRALEVLNQYDDLDDDTYINISEVLQKKKETGDVNGHAKT